MQTGSCKGKYNQQLKIDRHFLFSANATHFNSLYSFLHLAHIPILNLSLYGLPDLSSFLPFFSHLLVSQKLFPLHISQRKLNFNLSAITNYIPQSTFSFHLHFCGCSSNHHLFSPVPTQQPPDWSHDLHLCLTHSPS